MDGGRLRPFLEPVTVVGTLLSILAGLVSFISGDSDVVLGVVVGLSVQAIALLVQIILRLEANVARLGRSGALLEAVSEHLAHHQLEPQDLAWHRSDVGRRYWAMQLDALARGWKIQRIFIYDTWTADLDSLAGEHKSAGVRVKRILTRELPSGLVVDVTTWGNTHAYEQRVRVEGTTTLDRFSVNEVDIRRCSDLFRRIDDLAEAF